MNHSRLPSYISDYFKVELDSLGPDQFAKWLKDSFHSEAPAPIPPYFQTPELDAETFGEVYETAIHDLDEIRKEIVANAVQRALAGFPQSGRYEGLFSLVLLGEALDLSSLGDLLAGVFSRALPLGTLQPKLPDTAIEAFSLRETLECGFRKVWRGQPGVTKLSEWAYRFMTQVKVIPPEIKPALSPLYVLARRGLLEQNLSGAKHKNALAILEAAFRGGYYVAEDPFPEFFKIRIDGELYPTDVEEVLQTVDTWLAATKGRRKPLLPERFQGDPLGRASISSGHPSNSVYGARLEREQSAVLEGADG